MKIPVEVQKPNKPDSARYVGHAEDSWTVERVARYVGVPNGCLIDGKIMGGKKKPRRWSLVAYVEFGAILIAMIALTTVTASAQQQRVYDSSGRSVGTVTTDSQGSTVIRDSSGRTTGTTSTDSQGTTTFRDSGGRSVGSVTAPSGGRR